MEMRVTFGQYFAKVLISSELGRARPSLRRREKRKEKTPSFLQISQYYWLMDGRKHLCDVYFIFGLVIYSIHV